MSENTPDPAGKGLARRRLLRGTFATPAVLTLVSGSALAQTSNMRCLSAQVDDPIWPPVSNALDDYPRVELASLTPNGANKSPTYYVVGSTVASLNRSPLYTLSPGEWQVFDAVNNTDVNGAIQTSQPSGSGGSATYLENSGKFAVLRFNKDGQVTGVGVGPAASAATQSCLNSFAGVA